MKNSSLCFFNEAYLLRGGGQLVSFLMKLQVSRGNITTSSPSLVSYFLILICQASKNVYSLGSNYDGGMCQLAGSSATTPYQVCKLDSKLSDNLGDTF